MQVKRYIITTGTVTYAIKARDILRKNGFKAATERITSGAGSAGCGYAVIINENLDKAVDLLKKSGIKPYILFLLIHSSRIRLSETICIGCRI